METNDGLKDDFAMKTKSGWISLYKVVQSSFSHFERYALARAMVVATCPIYLSLFLRFIIKMLPAPVKRLPAFADLWYSDDLLYLRMHHTNLDPRLHQSRANFF